jgi:hypothetical protein
VPLFRRNEDLHHPLVIVDFLFPSTYFLVSFLYTKFCDPAIVINRNPEVPKLTNLPDYHHDIFSLKNPSKNPLNIMGQRTHYTSCNQTPPSSKRQYLYKKEKGSLSSTRCHGFSPFLSFYTFPIMFSTQAFVSPLGTASIQGFDTPLQQISSPVFYMNISETTL